MPFTIVTRPSAEHADVSALQDAYTAMQALSGSDNRSWIYWAEYHGFNRYECWHHARMGSSGTFPYDLFLPWHRAYLAFFENVARDQNSDAVLPWWDWSSDLSHEIGLPDAYTNGGEALESGTIPAINGDPERRTVRNPSPPADLPSAERVEFLLGLTDYRDFSNQLQDTHDEIHGWVGGDMGSIGTSAFDAAYQRCDVHLGGARPARPRPQRLPRRHRTLRGRSQRGLVRRSRLPQQPRCGRDDRVRRSELRGLVPHLRPRRMSR
jgi:hypothetical protein